MDSAYQRVLKFSQMIAVLASSDAITDIHPLEALQRCLKLDLLSLFYEIVTLILAVTGQMKVLENK